MPWTTPVPTVHKLPGPPLTPAEMDLQVARAGLALNPGQMGDLVMAWRQLSALIASIPRPSALADDQAYVFRLAPPPAASPGKAAKPKSAGAKHTAPKPAAPKQAAPKMAARKSAAGKQAAPKAAAKPAAKAASRTAKPSKPARRR